MRAQVGLQCCDVDYRVARADDPDVAGLLEEYFAYRESNAASLGIDYRRFPPNPAEFVPPRGEYVVAWLHDQAVGCVGLRTLDSPHRIFEIKNLWVRPEARRRGVARGLLSRAEADAAGFGAAILRLDTHRSLAHAIALYRRSGFLPIPRYNDNPNATEWFEKRLSPAQ